MATGKLITLTEIQQKINRGARWIEGRMRAKGRISLMIDGRPETRDILPFPEPEIAERGRAMRWDEAAVDRWIAGYVTEFLGDSTPERW